VIRKRWLERGADLTTPPIKRPKKNLLPVAKDDPMLAPDACAAWTAAMSRADAVVCPSADANDSTSSIGEEELAPIAEGWRKQGVLVISPPSVNDDWVQLYIATAMCARNVTGVQLVTGDHFRDHFWRMRRPSAFRTWRERHLTGYRLRRPDSDEGCAAAGVAGADPEGIAAGCWAVELVPPPSYSHNVQATEAGGCWHFPIRAGQTDADSVETRFEWLVAWDPAVVCGASTC